MHTKRDDDADTIFMNYIQSAIKLTLILDCMERLVYVIPAGFSSGGLWKVGRISTVQALPEMIARLTSGPGTDAGAL